MTFALHSSLQGLSTNYVIYSCSMWNTRRINLAECQIYC